MDLEFDTAIRGSAQPGLPTDGAGRVHLDLPSLQTRLYAEGMDRHGYDTRTSLLRALRLPWLRDALEWEPPGVTTLPAGAMEVSGRIDLIRFDCYRNADNLKKPIVAGLLLRRLAQGPLHNDVNCLVDAGSMNMGYALRHYCRRFGLRGAYVMSRYFCDDMVADLAADDFEVFRAPGDLSLGREREFYSHLVHRLQNRLFRQGRLCLWHSKYGGDVAWALGTELAATFPRDIDVAVTTIGSGATLQMLSAMRAQLRTATRPDFKIVVAEHVRSPILARKRPLLPRLPSPPCMVASMEAFRRPPQGIPHSILGPHYDDLNPFLDERSISEVDLVQQYDDPDWIDVSMRLRRRGESMGNSSAACLAVAAAFAAKGLNAASVVAEPDRWYYAAPSP